MKNRPAGLLIIMLFLLAGQLQAFPPVRPNRNVTPDSCGSWVDSVYYSLSMREKIGQLIMVAAYSNRGPEHQASIEYLIRRYGIGGICFFQGGPVRQTLQANRYQSVSKVPVLMAIDAEWGPAMRLDSTPRFPYQMALGAIRDPELLYRMGAEIARELALTGIQMNFAPVVDANSNPANPVINYRSFGENPAEVARLGAAYMNGMQDLGILATAKHFPGHGDADTDSHLALPRISRSRAQLDSVELVPFARLIESGLSSVMVAHLEVPALEPQPGLPTTLSRRVISDLLRNELKFNGLIVTDALNMKGVSTAYPPGEMEVRALEAGNDMLVFVEKVDVAVRAIEDAIASGRITGQEIETRVKRVLSAKYRAGLHVRMPADTTRLAERLNSPAAESLNRELTAASLTCVVNRDSLMPVRDLAAGRIASLVLGRNTETRFQLRLKDYAPVETYQLGSQPGREQLDALVRKLGSANLVVIGVHNMDQRASKGFGIPDWEADLIAALAEKVPVITVLFGNPYAIARLREPGTLGGLVVAYQESDASMDLSAQLIFGGIGASGRLPVTAGKGFEAGTGISTTGGIRLSYTTPESVGIASGALRHRIDSLCLSGIAARAYPGCEVLAAVDGKIFFQSCYGTHTYEDRLPVTEDDLFDLASVTKVSAPLPAIMALVDDGKINLDRAFSDYWAPFKGTDKQMASVRQMLAHVAGLPGWIPFWRDAVNPDGTWKEKTLVADSSADYPVRVSQGLWRHRDYAQVIYDRIRDEPSSKPGKYVYSDLGFHIWPRVISQESGTEYETFLRDRFYRPLGASTLGYNPMKRYTRDRIVPTERDTFFRMELLHGYVHDEGAAMLGGVSGNAGLFGTAGDLAKLFQMYLWSGSYGGSSYVTSATLTEFRRCQYEKEGIRRGLGFDKPMIGNDTLKFEDSYPCPAAPPESFGHSGYTGTFVWADPTTGLLFIFLCNRVYPTRDNNKLTDLYIRKNILQTLYEQLPRANGR